MVGGWMELRGVGVQIGGSGCLLFLLICHMFTSLLFLFVHHESVSSNYKRILSILHAFKTVAGCTEKRDIGIKDHLYRHLIQHLPQPSLVRDYLDKTRSTTAV